MLVGIDGILNSVDVFADADQYVRQAEVAAFGIDIIKCVSVMGVGVGININIRFITQPGFVDWAFDVGYQGIVCHI